jgi:hypothetical protein
MIARRAIAAALILATTVTGSYGVVHATNDPFNFVYAVQSERDYASTLVFDDGKQTYFQFPKGKRPTGVFVRNVGGGLEKVTLAERGPYWQATGIGSHFVVLDGKRRVATIESRKARPALASRRVDPGSESASTARSATKGSVERAAAPVRDDLAQFLFMGPLAAHEHRVRPPVITQSPLPLVAALSLTPLEPVREPTPAFVKDAPKVMPTPAAATPLVTTTVSASPTLDPVDGPAVRTATVDDISELRKQVGQLQQLVHSLLAALGKNQQTPAFHPISDPSVGTSKESIAPRWALGDAAHGSRPTALHAKLASTTSSPLDRARMSDAHAESPLQSAVFATAIAAPKGAGLPPGAIAHGETVRSVEFIIYGEEKLSVAVRRLVEQEGFNLDWDPDAGDFLVPTGFRMRDTSLQTLLARVLGHFHLSSHIRHGNKIVAISRG